VFYDFVQSILAYSDYDHNYNRTLITKLAPRQANWNHLVNG